MQERNINDPNAGKVKETLTAAQAYFMASNKRYLWFCAGRGCFAPGTEIRMYDGSVKKVEDIQEGDYLVGDDMGKRLVLGTKSGEDEIYRVTLEDKSFYDCNKGHTCVVVDESDGMIKEIDLEDLIGKEDNYRHIRVVDGTPKKLKFKTEYKSFGKYFGFLLDNNNRFILNNGIISKNSGKTRIGARWIYKNVIRFPQGRGLICANTYGQLRKATLPPVLAYFREIGLKYVVNKRPPESWIKDFPIPFDRYENILVTETGAHIFLGSLDDPEPLRGFEYGWVWIDEISSTTKVAWDIIVGGLRDKYVEEDYHCIRVTGTPDGDNWTWREFKKKWDKDPTISQYYDIVFMSSRENPWLPKKTLEGMLASYDRRRALQEVDGRILTDQAANIYYEWRSGLHVKKHEELIGYDPNSPLILCWDFNASKESPMSMVIAQQHTFSNGQPFVYVIDEIVIPMGNTPLVCEKFIERYFGKHKSELYIYGDATGRSRSATVGINDYQMIKEQLGTKFPHINFRVPKGNMPEKDRTAAVNTLFLNAKGELRLFIHPRCVELIKDFDELVPDNFGKINKKDPARSHTSDALGYYIAQEFPVGGAKQVSAAPINLPFNLGYR